MIPRFSADVFPLISTHVQVVILSKRVNAHEPNRQRIAALKDAGGVAWCHIDGSERIHGFQLKWKRILALSVIAVKFIGRHILVGFSNGSPRFEPAHNHGKNGNEYDD